MDEYKKEGSSSGWWYLSEEFIFVYFLVVVSFAINPNFFLFSIEIVLFKLMSQKQGSVKYSLEIKTQNHHFGTKHEKTFARIIKINKI